MQIFIVFIALMSLLSPQSSSAHGEDSYGPNGGYIRMPGSYHTEVVPTGKNKLKIYLIDVNNKNPTTKDSNVQVTINSGEQGVCSAQKQYFSCEFPESVDIKNKGELKLETVRENEKGVAAVYPLPLTHAKASTKAQDKRKENEHKHAH